MVWQTLCCIAPFCILLSWKGVPPSSSASSVPSFPPWQRLFGEDAPTGYSCHHDFILFHQSVLLSVLALPSAADIWQVLLSPPMFQGLKTDVVFLPFCPCVSWYRLRWWGFFVFVGSSFHIPFISEHSWRSFLFSNKPTSIFLCKVSASGVPQGSPSGLVSWFFSSFWGAVAPDPKTLWSEMKKITAIPCLFTPSSCLLLHARKININLKK